MACLRLNPFVAAMVAGSLIVSSTGAVAATPSSAAPQAVNPWAALTALSAGAPAAALCGAAATAVAVQGAAPGCVLPVVDQPPPPPAPAPVPAVEPMGGGFGMSPWILALGAIAAAALIYFLVRKHHNNSPT
jgi:hypothetical protein